MMPATEQQKYTVYVLWLRGHTEAYCAKAAGLRERQVAGLIWRSPYRNRSAMTDQERQSLLDQLEPLRLDRRLKDIAFKIEPLDRKQQR